MMQKIKIKMLQKTIKGVDSSMRHKIKKEAVDTIAMRIANDAYQKSLEEYDQLQRDLDRYNELADQVKNAK